MNNELMINGTQNFMGFNIPVIEGGFGADSKCVLAKTFAELNKTELKEVNRIITKNIDEFEFGVDILDLKQTVELKHRSENIVNMLLEVSFTSQNIKVSKNIYLLSEQGVVTLSMLMRTPRAKEVRKTLKTEYFRMRELLESDEQKKAQLLLQLYNGGIDSIEAHRKLSEIETKPLLEKIEEQAPVVAYCEEVLKPTGLVTITDIAKDLGMSGQKLNKILKEKGVIYKGGECWKPYAGYQYLVPDYCDYEISGNGIYSSQHLKWTELGRKFIIEEVLETESKIKRIA